MLNYLRYFIVAILLGSIFYTYTITIEEGTIVEAIDKKMPMTIEKKGFVVTLNSVTINNISQNIVESTIDGSIKMSDSNLIGKYLKKEEGNFLTKMFKKNVDVNEFVNKSINLDIFTKTTPQLKGSSLSFKITYLDINELVKVRNLKGYIKDKVEDIKIPIKKLESLSWLASTKKINFEDNGDLNIDLGISKLIILILIPLFLLREIGLFLIMLYQQFLSPRKGYKCAKGHLHQNGTCSSTTKQAFQDGGFISGIKEYKKSTKECKEAYNTIKEKENRKGKACETAGCVGCDGLAFAGETGAESACEAGSCDVGSCDVGSCDVGSCDIGSC